jgi:hypothetical protein
MVTVPWLNAATMLRAGGCADDQAAFAEAGMKRVMSMVVIVALPNALAPS